MAEQTTDPSTWGTINIEVTNHGSTYTLNGSTFTTGSSGTILISNHKMPDELAQYIVQTTIETLSRQMAQDLAKSAYAQFKKAYADEVAAGLAAWKAQSKDKIIKKLTKQAEEEFLARFEKD